MIRVWLLAIWLNAASEVPTSIEVFYEPEPCYAAAGRRVTTDAYRATDCVAVSLYAAIAHGNLSSLTRQPRVLEGATGQSFYTIVPCRVADTRFFGGAVPGDATRHFKVRGSFAQGAQATCGIPAEATAAVFNITAVAPAGTGWLTAWPFGLPQPPASSSFMNYSAGQTSAGGGLMLLCDPGLGCVSDLSIYTTQRTDLVVDVTGYLRR